MTGFVSEPPAIHDFESLLERAAKLAESGERRILGITGPPGVGKSTLAAKVVRRLGGYGDAGATERSGDRAVDVPMDGFHLANAELRRLGRLERKGAIDTFDPAGYVALLRRLRDAGPDTVYAPRFHREIEEPVGCAIPVPRQVPLVVTEGNYLLADQGPWAEIRGLLDDAWYLDLDEKTRFDRLVRRHVAYGKGYADAREWVMRSDQRNAEIVAATRHRADLVVDAVRINSGPRNRPSI